MITIVVHDSAADKPLRVDPALIAFLLAKPPLVTRGGLPGKRTLVYAMSREEWEREFPADSPATT